MLAIKTAFLILEVLTCRSYGWFYTYFHSFCNPRTSDSAWEIVGAQQRCFRWKSDCLQGSSLPSQSGSPQQVSTMCSGPSVNHSPLVTCSCSESPALPPWRLQQLPGVCAASACWLPPCVSVSSTFPPLLLLSSWEPKPSWEQGRGNVLKPFSLPSRCKDLCTQWTSHFLEPGN